MTNLKDFVFKEKIISRLRIYGQNILGTHFDWSAYLWCKIQHLVCSKTVFFSKNCGLAVEHSAHDQKVVGLIPVQC